MRSSVRGRCQTRVLLSLSGLTRRQWWFSRKNPLVRSRCNVFRWHPSSLHICAVRIHAPAAISVVISGAISAWQVAESVGEKIRFRTLIYRKKGAADADPLHPPKALPWLSL